MPLETSHPVRHLVIAMLLIGTLSSCSKRDSPVVEDEPLLPDSPDITRAEVNAGGITTRYVAHFEGKQLQRISEVRVTDGDPNAKRSGNYSFNGGRLIEYQGAALGSDAQISVTFDMRGAVTASQGEAGEKEISAIQDRAQLLRSLALARRSTQEHGGS